MEITRVGRLLAEGRMPVPDGSPPMALVGVFKFERPMDGDGRILYAFKSDGTGTATITHADGTIETVEMQRGDQQPVEAQAADSGGGSGDGNAPSAAPEAQVAEPAEIAAGDQDARGDRPGEDAEPVREGKDAIRRSVWGFVTMVVTIVVIHAVTLAELIWAPPDWFTTKLSFDCSVFGCIGSFVLLILLLAVYISVDVRDQFSGLVE